jgi:hypothetical protein
MSDRRQARRGKEKMSRLRWIVATFGFATFAAASFAQSTPPDGQIGVKQSIHSTPITSLTQAITFSPCSGSVGDILAECNEFSTNPALQPQEVFGGINETGTAWNTFSITLNGLNSIDSSVGCAVTTFFSQANCVTHPVTIPTGTDESVTLTFTQGSGTGIGCINTINPTDPKNNTCMVNSFLNVVNNLTHGTSLPYDLFFRPVQLNGPCTVPTGFPPGAVCGSDDFVIGIGLAGMHFVDPPTSGSLSANTPEPQTLFLVGGAMLAMLLLGLRKTRLV